MKIVSAFAAVVILALGTTAVSSQQDPIAARKAMMKSNGQAAGSLAKMVKGEAPFDLPTAQKAFATFEDAAVKMPALFPDNSKIGGETTAAPSVLVRARGRCGSIQLGSRSLPLILQFPRYRRD